MQHLKKKNNLTGCVIICFSPVKYCLGMSNILLLTLPVAGIVFRVEMLVYEAVLISIGFGHFWFCVGSALMSPLTNVWCILMYTEGPAEMLRESASP